LGFDLALDVDLNYPARRELRKLDVYQVAVRFLPLPAALAGSLPPRYTASANQLRRASLSIPLNIAEGSEKSTGPDQRRFYIIARGSAMECAAILDACTAMALIEQPEPRKSTNFFSQPLGCSRKCVEHKNVQV